MRLMLLEMKRILKNPLFWISIALIFAFIYSQFGSGIDISDMDKPLPNQENYGITQTKDMSIIREKAIAQLLQEYSFNSYTTYPYGFYRQVELNDKKNLQIAKIISAISGTSIEEIQEIQKKQQSSLMNGEQTQHIMIAKAQDSISDQEFLDLMDKADELLGGGSFYSKKLIASQFGKRPKTYEEAIEDYELMINKDRVSGAYARLFCDYAGIIIGIIPIFLAVAIWFRDQRSKCQDLLFTRKTSSLKFIISRYLAMLILFSISLMVMGSYYNIQIIKEFGLNKVNPFYFYGYILIWLIPILAVLLSIGTFTTIATNSPSGILVMMIWWFLDVMNGFPGIKGGYGNSLILRHNIVGNTQIYLNNKTFIFINRGAYILFAIAILVISITIYNLKREGKVFVRGIHKK